MKVSTDRRRARRHATASPNRPIGFRTNSDTRTALFCAIRANWPIRDFAPNAQSHAYCDGIAQSRETFKLGSTPVRAANRKTSFKSISQQIRNTELEESTLTKSDHAAFRADLGQKTLIFSPARPVRDDAQQNAQVDCRKVLAPNGPSVLLWCNRPTIVTRKRRGSN
jgi:hypothetical protein